MFPKAFSPWLYPFTITSRVFLWSICALKFKLIPQSKHFSNLLCFLSFCFAVFDRTEEVILPDRQDMSHSDQSPHHSSPGCRDQSHACLQKSWTRDRGGETLPEPRAQPRIQRRSVEIPPPRVSFRPSLFVVAVWPYDSCCFQVR